ncbi:MAG: GLUG motif-containing protein [Candidatus Thermoplasmatota archaeon]|nr:GLUG motif-containing protein [Candidatus Thermoplasmatota archaeon]
MKFKSMMAILLIMIMVLPSFSMMNDIEVGGVEGYFGGGSGTSSDPFIIEDVWDLQNMNENLSAYYVLKNDIDASETETWNDGAGFLPIGERYKKYMLDLKWSGIPFTGSLDGNDHTISGIYVDRIGNMSTNGYWNSIGFFGHIGPDGSVKDLDMVEYDITGNMTVGGLVGFNKGTISNCSFSGSVTGAHTVGGLIGNNEEGTLSNCHVDVEVNGTSTGGGIVYQFNTGGVVGTNSGEVEDCSSSGNVIGISMVGGLIGENDKGGTISNCASTTNVTGSGVVGGLIGDNEEEVSHCHSTGDVRSEKAMAGGLIATNFGNAPITDCYSTGDIFGTEMIGGLIGINNAVVSRCFSTGNVNGNGGLGGLIATNDGDISVCFSSGRVDCMDGYNRSDGSTAGGLVGSNTGSIENSFSTSIVTLTSNFGGGLIGINHEGIVRYCYSAGEVRSAEYENTGGLVGNDTEGSVENCYWDNETSGQEISDGGEGRTTLEMKSRATFSSWDFGSTWAIFDGVDYPYLQAFPPGARILSPRFVGTLAIGDSLRFKGSDLPGQNIGHQWTFGDGRTSEMRSPGLLPFLSTGSQEVSYSFTGDDLGSLEGDTIDIEVVDDPQSYSDLTVMGYNIPETLSIGDTASITYYVVNIGEASITGKTWKDSIYLSDDQYLDAMDTRLASGIISMDVPKDGGYQGHLNITPPAMKEGPYYLIISLNDEWSFVEVHRLNNERERAIDIAIPELHEGIEYESEYSSGPLDQYFRIYLPSSKNIHLTLEGPTGLEMMVRHGDLPLRSVYDHHSSNGELTKGTIYIDNLHLLYSGTDIKDVAMNGNPKQFKLNQNYPNPFNNTTTIEYYLPTKSAITIEIYNLLGAKVATLIRKVQFAGSHKVEFNGDNLSSGIYFYVVKGFEKGNKSNHFSSVKKFILLK